MKDTCCCRRWMWLIALVASATVPAWAGGNFDAVEVRLGNSEPQRHLVHILNVGRIPIGTKRELVLQVRNASKDPLQIDAVAIGPHIDVRWHEENGVTMPARILLVPEAVGELILSLDFSTSHQQLNTVSLLQDSVPITHVVIDYSLHPGSYSYEIASPEAGSPTGNAWSEEYQVATGPAPHGYALSAHRFAAGGSERGCTVPGAGSWMECRLIQANDDDVIYGFKIQGFEHDNERLGDESRHAVGRIFTTYTLIESQPILSGPKEEVAAKP